MTAGTLDRGTRARWSVGYWMAQIVVLALAGLGLLLASWGSPVMEAILRDVTLVAGPWLPLVPVRVVVPLLLPLALGVPLALSRQRAPLLLYIAMMTLVASLAVVEAARLNWAAFLSGIAFRVADPVPFLRSAGGLAVVLSGVLLMSHQSVHQHVHLLVQRGVASGEVGLVRSRLLARERALVAGAYGAGLLLLFVAGISMRLTERAPREEVSILPVLLWVLLLLATLAAVMSLLARRGGGHDRAPPRQP